MAAWFFAGIRNLHNSLVIQALSQEVIYGASDHEAIAPSPNSSDGQLPLLVEYRIINCIRKHKKSRSDD